MKLFVVGLLLLPVTFMLILAYLSGPQMRRIMFGCSLLVLSVTIFIGSWLTYYDQFIRPRTGVLGSYVPMPFWEEMQSSIVTAMLAFLQGIVFIIIGIRQNRAKKDFSH